MRLSAHSRLLLLCFFALSALASAAGAAEEAERGTVMLRSLVRTTRNGVPDAGADPAWRAFETKHGAWRAEWNALTASPHRAYGPAIALDGFRDDAVSAERAVRAFIAREPGLFGAAPALERVAATRAERVWYVRFRPVVGGLPVLFADSEFRVGTNGRLMAFGADALRGAIVADAAAPRVGAAVARAAAVDGIAFDPGRDRAEVGETLALVPLATDRGLELRAVYDVRVHTVDPPGEWVALVDAVTAEVRFRLNRVRYDIGGTVTGQIHLDLPTDPLVATPMPHENVGVGASQVVTALNGTYSSPAAGTVSVATALVGPYCNVNRQDAPDAAINVSATNPATVDFAFTTANSQDAERDAFYHVNLVHDYVKTLDPAFTGVDYSMPCAVNIAATCNAFWDGTGVNFYLAGGGCPNTGTMPDVVYHEYGHGINDRLYVSQGAPFGMVNGALHEGTADVNACMVLDRPEVGRGFFGVGTVLRNADNTNRWPENDGEIHFSGQIISGAFWDLRQAIGLAATRRLAHFAKYGLPDDPDNGVAMHEFFVETLVADDDDADLSNGTPHSADIIAAFNAHGIGTAFFLSIAHAPLTDTPDHGPYPVTATIQHSGPFGALDAGSPTLHYSIDGGTWQTLPMTPTGTPDQFRASLPPQFVGVVRYYLTAADNFGASWASPLAAPFRGVNLFLAGPVSTFAFANMETNPGWTVGGPDDNATSGLWVRANPVGAYVDADVSQPEDDHTPGAGTLCWITGNAAAGAAAGTADVDGGQTTLTTATFGANGLTRPLVEFYRWYRNDLGSAPASDTFHVQISNDNGATWTTMDDVMTSAGDWVRSLYFIEDFVTPTANMKLRFRAADFGAGSLVEAGIDDFRLLAVSGLVDVATAPAPATWSLVAAPNPFRHGATIRWSLPEAADVTLDVYDVAGRRVRGIERGPAAAGVHASTWDGRDDAGAPARAGIYFVRLASGARELRAKIVRLE